MDKQQIIKNLKKSNTCSYPKCKNKYFAQIMLPIGQITESGQITFPNEDKVQSSCPLCEYHMIFAEKGIINLVEVNKLIQLMGAFPIIEIVEAVFEANEFKNSMNKAKKKNAKIKKSK